MALKSNKRMTKISSYHSLNPATAQTNEITVKGRSFGFSLQNINLYFNIAVFAKIISGEKEILSNLIQFGESLSNLNKVHEILSNFMTDN